MSKTKQLSTVVYAPENTAFMHTHKDQFTYFKGSKSGSYSTFGLSTAELNTLFQKFVLQVKGEYENSTSQQIKEQIFNLENLAKEFEVVIAVRKNDLKGGGDYKTANKITGAVHRYGHIPLILSAYRAPIVRTRSAQTVSVSDVQEYCFASLGAYTQAIEFVHKQSMMEKIASLRNSLVQLRYTVSRSDSLFYFCNAVIVKLDNDIIEKNQKSLPDLEKFDRPVPFLKNVAKAVFSIPKGEDGNQLKGVLEKYAENANTTAGQKQLSEKLYGAVKNIVISLGFDDNDDSGSGEEVVVTKAAYTRLKYLLPLINYLNSPTNPWAQNGVHGKVFTSPLHNQALNEYAEHESHSFDSYSYNHSYGQVYTNLEKEFGKEEFNNSIEFNEAQIDQLIYGNEDVQQSSGFFSRLTQTLTGGSGPQREKVLALPQPEQYLMLEYKPQKLSNDTTK